jgi:hypothetical protein
MKTKSLLTIPGLDTRQMLRSTGKLRGFTERPRSRHSAKCFTTGQARLPLPSGLGHNTWQRLPSAGPCLPSISRPRMRHSAYHLVLAAPGGLLCLLCSYNNTRRRPSFAEFPILYSVIHFFLVSCALHLANKIVEAFFPEYIFY